MPAHANSNAPVIFKKPIVRAHVYSLGLLHFYQSDNRRSARAEFSNSLNKIASARLVDEVQQVFYQRVVSKIRKWYTDESRDLAVEVARKRTEAYFTTLASELGIEDDGLKPFTERAIDWREYRSVEGYTVFNVEQIEGLPAQYTAPASPRLDVSARIARAECFFGATDATVAHGGTRACYRPSTDSIVLPLFETFRDAESYYATLAHETDALDRTRIALGARLWHQTFRVRRLRDRRTRGRPRRRVPLCPILI